MTNRSPSYAHILDEISLIVIRKQTAIAQPIVDMIPFIAAGLAGPKSQHIMRFPFPPSQFQQQFLEGPNDILRRNR